MTRNPCLATLHLTLDDLGPVAVTFRCQLMGGHITPHCQILPKAVITWVIDDNPAREPKAVVSLSTPGWMGDYGGPGGEPVDR